MSALNRISVAVVGSGISALSFARNLLSKHGENTQVSLFEKSKGPSGRISTRRIDISGINVTFDHGAQYFTVKNKIFENENQKMEEKGVVKEWKGKIGVLEHGKVSPTHGDMTRYVGVEGMNAIGKHLAQGLNIRYETRITKIKSSSNKKWSLEAENGQVFGDYDYIVVTCPAGQTAELLEGVAPHLAVKAKSVKFHPCWCVMLAVEKGTVPLDLDGAFVHDSPLSWISRNSSKPGRDNGKIETWVLDGSPSWSEEHFNENPERVQEQLIQSFKEAVSSSSNDVSIKILHSTAHRWRYSMPDPLPDPYLFDNDLRIAACGDWCGGSRVEGAYMSGYNLSERLVQTIEASSKSNY